MAEQVARAVKIALECDIANTTALWDAAASRAAADFAMTSDDVIETIGPREDPEIEACVSMLFDAFVRVSGVFAACDVSVLSQIAPAPAMLRLAPVAGPSPLDTSCAA